MGKKSGPDTSGINASAVQNAAVSKEALDFYKKQYADEAPARDKAADVANRVSEQQLASAQQQDAIAKDYNDYSKSTFRPVEESIVADAKSYDTAERRTAEANAAVADVNQGVAAQRAATSRDLARSGVSPEGAKMQSIQDAGDINAAKLSAGAAYSARKNVETQGHARMMDAASLGRNLPSQQATSAQLALTAGNSASANAQTPVNIGNASTAQMGQGFNLASQATQSSGNLYGQAIQIKSGASAASNGALMQGVGGIAQGIGAYFSSKKLKTDRRGVDPKRALMGVNKLKVEDWRYKDGVADSGEHVGPYAEDMHREFGDEAAPGGHMINMDASKDINLQAIRELTSKLASLESEIEELQAA